MNTQETRELVASQISKLENQGWKRFNRELPPHSGSTCDGGLYHSTDLIVAEVGDFNHPNGKETQHYIGHLAVPWADARWGEVTCDDYINLYIVNTCLGGTDIVSDSSRIKSHYLWKEIK